MVSLLTYDKSEKELQELRSLSKDIVALLSDEYWKMEHAHMLEHIKQFFKEQPLLDMLLYDISQKDDLEYLQDIRKEYKETLLMLIADIKTSPMDYLKPSIGASSLLIRPWSKEQAREVLEEFFCVFMEQMQQEQDDKVYLVETKEGTQRIPYNQIYFFEAREKKIYVCIGKEEMGFYDTIDNLSEKLPEQFVRCHRGFIVNKHKIKKVALSQNLIFLTDGYDVPLSRSYKSVVKGLYK